MPYRHWYAVATVDRTEHRLGPYASRLMAERKARERGHRPAIRAWSMTSTQSIPTFADTDFAVPPGKGPAEGGHPRPPSASLSEGWRRPARCARLEASVREG